MLKEKSVKIFLFQGDRGAILTTHSMEEADALCSRVGIMVKGELRYFYLILNFWSQQKGIQMHSLLAKLKNSSYLIGPFLANPANYRQIGLALVTQS